MLPEFPEFKILELKDIPEIQHYFKRTKPKICEYNLANVLIWQDFDRPLLTIINRNLCLYISPPNEPPYFLEPAGGHKSQETLDICLKHAGRISRAGEEFISRIDFKKYKITCLRDQFDYIYETRTLAELKGRKYDGKRNHIKRFRERFPDHKFIRLDASLMAAAMELFETWFERKKESRHFPKLAYTAQKAALEKAFLHPDQLKLRGTALFLEEEMKGLILGSALNPDTASVHFQYGDPSIRGVSQALLWEACRNIFSDFKYLNLEQDLGIPGLRKAKLSYCPLRLEKKFEIRPIQK